MCLISINLLNFLNFLEPSRNQSKSKSLKSETLLSKTDVNYLPTRNTIYNQSPLWTLPSRKGKTCSRKFASFCSVNIVQSARGQGPKLLVACQHIYCHMWQQYLRLLAPFIFSVICTKWVCGLMKQLAIIELLRISPVRLFFSEPDNPSGSFFFLTPRHFPRLDSDMEFVKTTTRSIACVTLFPDMVAIILWAHFYWT